MHRLSLDKEFSQEHFRDPKARHRENRCQKSNKKPLNFLVQLCALRSLRRSQRIFSSAELKIVQEKNISNPYLFRGVLMVTTFVHSAGSRTKGVWKFLEKASRLAKLEYPSLRKIMSYCSVRVPIYVHSCFSWSLKLQRTVRGWPSNY